MVTLLVSLTLILTQTFQSSLLLLLIRIIVNLIPLLVLQNSFQKKIIKFIPSHLMILILLLPSVTKELTRLLL
ncbi:hypothetical protein H8356DRAFT_1616688 [Neocallimastix lanati (nom. inval.)]|nr:hypothetical protein H8356DRAFT_1616688 [Neocallimastix sp. JGI-2020a]